MASLIESSSSNKIVIAYDATKSRDHEFKDIIANVRMRGDVIQEGDTIAVLGALHKIGNDSFIVKHTCAIEEEASRKVDAYVDMLQNSAAECEGEKFDIEVNVAVGAPMRNVIVQEIVASNAAWAVLDRYIAPEYAENGSSSVKTDVYAFGVVLIQLISGRKAIESTRGSSPTIS